MPKDWEKSRAQLLAELRLVRRQRDVLAARQKTLERLLHERAARPGGAVDVAATEPADVAIYELDAEGRVVRWTRAAERLKGFTADEVLGRHVSAFYPADERAQAARNLAIAAARGFHKDGGWRLAKDAGRFWADVVIMPRRACHGELLGFTKVVHGLGEAAGPAPAAERAPKRG